MAIDLSTHPPTTGHVAARALTESIESQSRPLAGVAAAIKKVLDNVLEQGGDPAEDRGGQRLHRPPRSLADKTAPSSEAPSPRRLWHSSTGFATLPRQLRRIPQGYPCAGRGFFGTLAGCAAVPAVHVSPVAVLDRTVSLKGGTTT